MLTLCCCPVQGDMETPFSKTLATVGSLEGPETPNSADSMVRCPHQCHSFVRPHPDGCLNSKAHTTCLSLEEPSEHLSEVPAHCKTPRAI